jgi:hypothetical protein
MSICKGIRAFRPRFSIQSLLVAVALTAYICAVGIPLWSTFQDARRTSASNRLLEPLIRHHWNFGAEGSRPWVASYWRSRRDYAYHDHMLDYYRDLLRQRCIELPPLPPKLEAERRQIEAERRTARRNPRYVLVEPPTSSRTLGPIPP